MALFSVSDIVIAVTLIINSLALMSTKFRTQTETLSSTSIPIKQSQDIAINIDINQETNQLIDNSNKNEEIVSISIVDRLNTLMYSLRRLSFIIVLWNILFIVLMIAVFSS